MAEGNKFTVGNGGRPPKFKTVLEIENKISDYFESLLWEDKEGDIQSKPPTITGLALFLGFDSRQSIYDYKERPQFSYTIKRACLAIENSYEEMLFERNATGSIFALKNMGWKDKTETDVNLNSQAPINGLSLIDVQADNSPK